MKRVSIALIWLVVLSSVGGALQAAGGSKKPEPASPVAEPAEVAADNYNRALDYRDKAGKLEQKAAADPEAAEKYLKKASAKYRRMEDSLRVALEADPRMYQAYSSLGYALRKQGHFDQSVEAYNQALTIEPSYTEAIEYRAEAYLGLGQFEDVKVAYMQLFRSDREKADQLMKAAQEWLDRQDEPGVEIAEFAAWLEERAQSAGQTASLTTNPNHNW